MKKYSLIFALIYSLSFAQGVLYASSFSVITVNEAKVMPHDSWVVLNGNIINALPGGRHYTFRDSTGEIAVEIAQNIWRGLSVSPSDRVEICGEVVVNRGAVSVLVRAITGETEPGIRQGQAVTSRQTVTVGAARALPQDSWVILNGFILSAISNNTYLFSDQSGEIALEINNNIWRGLYVDVTDRVEVVGEVRINGGVISVRVRAIKIV